MTGLGRARGLAVCVVLVAGLFGMSSSGSECPGYPTQNTTALLLHLVEFVYRKEEVVLENNYREVIWDCRIDGLLGVR